MNKTILFCALLISLTYFGQAIEIKPHNAGWFPVNSYNGSISRNIVNVPIHLNKSVGFQMQNWSLYFRVVGPITNGIQTFSQEDISKLKLQISYVTSAKVNDDGLQANINNTGVDPGVIPFSTVTSPLVVNSPYNLQYTSYDLQVHLRYNVLLEGGSYIEKYVSWKNYKVYLEFELRNRKGEIMPYGRPAAPMDFDMQIMPTDAPPAENNYTIGLAPSATNVLLEFKTASDYANGVSNKQLKALSVTSKTPYIIEAYTLSNELSSSTSTLPINSVQLSLNETASGLNSSPIQLSTTTQSVFRSQAHSEPKWYDLNYFIKPKINSTSFFNKPYELYSGSVIFSITPQ